MSVLALLIVVGLLNSILGDGSAESFIDDDDAQDATGHDDIPEGESLTDFVIGTAYVQVVESDQP